MAANDRIKTFKCNTLKNNSCIELRDENNSAIESYMISYSTMVVSYSHRDKKMTVYGWYSPTTMRHINSFLSHFGYETMTKKQVESGEQPKLITTK